MATLQPITMWPGAGWQPDRRRRDQGRAVAGMFVNRLLTSFLAEIRPLEPSTIAVSALTPLLVSLLAWYVPARRAASLDPLDALPDA